MILKLFAANTPKMPPLLQRLPSIQRLTDTQYQSPSWGTPSMSPMPLMLCPVPVLASQQPNLLNIRPTLLEPLSELGVLNLIKRPSLSLVYAISALALQAVLEQGRRLIDKERLIVIRIC
jgi:hypothetical protein